jgi:hypothetical protein
VTVALLAISTGTFSPSNAQKYRMIFSFSSTKVCMLTSELELENLWLTLNEDGKQALKLTRKGKECNQTNKFTDEEGEGMQSNLFV